MLLGAMHLERRPNTDSLASLDNQAFIWSKKCTINRVYNFFIEISKILLLESDDRSSANMKTIDIAWVGRGKKNAKNVFTS